MHIFYTQTCVFVACARTYTCKPYTYTHVPRTHTRTHVDTHAHTRTRTSTHPHPHTFTRTRTRTHAQMHARTNVHTHSCTHIIQGCNRMRPVTRTNQLQMAQGNSYRSPDVPCTGPYICHAPHLELCCCAKAERCNGGRQPQEFPPIRVPRDFVTNVKV